MAKANRSKKDQVEGPYLDAAFICEQIIEEPVGADSDKRIYSAIRMVNRITFHEQIFNPGTVLLMPLILVISFKAGNVRDTRYLSVYVTDPSGGRISLNREVFPCPVTFTGGDTGAFTILRQFPIKYDKDGTYWIDILLDKKRYTRLPLTILTD